MSVEFRKVGPESAQLMAATRPLVWAETYRGIYSDSKIDNYDIKWYTARDRSRMMDRRQSFYLAMDGERCVGYFHYGPPHIPPYKDFDLCLNSLYFLKEYKGQGLGKRVLSTCGRSAGREGLKSFSVSAIATTFLPRLFMKKWEASLLSETTDTRTKARIN